MCKRTANYQVKAPNSIQRTTARDAKKTKHTREHKGQVKTFNILVFSVRREGGKGAARETHLPAIRLRFMLLRALPGPPACSCCAAPAWAAAAAGIAAAPAAAAAYAGLAVQVKPNCPARLRSLKRDQNIGWSLFISLLLFSSID